MPKRHSLVALCLFALALTALACAQDDSPPLGDVARKARQQKPQPDSQPQPNTAGPSAKDSAKDVPNNDASNKDVSNKNAAAQNKDAQSSDAASGSQPSKPAKHVITNDDIPSRGGPTGYRPPSGPKSWNTQPDPNAVPKLPAQVWSSQIQAMKTAIANLEAQIKQTSDSVQYASNCVSNCVQWNEQQQRKQQQVEMMKSQLDQYQQRLQEMQEGARRQGYGSSVYDP